MKIIGRELRSPIDVFKPELIYVAGELVRLDYVR